MSDLDIAISTILLGTQVTMKLYDVRVGQQKKALGKLLTDNLFNQSLREWVQNNYNKFGKEYCIHILKLSRKQVRLVQREWEKLSRQNAHDVVEIPINSKIPQKPVETKALLDIQKKKPKIAEDTADSDGSHHSTAPADPNDKLPRIDLRQMQVLKDPDDPQTTAPQPPSREELASPEADEPIQKVLQRLQQECSRKRTHKIQEDPAQSPLPTILQLDFDFDQETNSAPDQIQKQKESSEQAKQECTLWRQARAMKEQLQREDGQRELAISMYQEVKNFNTVAQKLGIEDIFKVVRWVKEHDMTTKRRYY